MEELTLRLTSLAGGMYRAEVSQSPYGDRPKHDFSPPLREEEVDRFHEQGAAYVSAVSGGNAPPDAAPGLSQIEVGERLAACLLGGEVEDHFRRCREAHDGLRLRLLFDPKDEGSGYLAALPWELIHSGDQFWGRKVGTPLVRDIALANRRQVLEIEPPLRILTLVGTDEEGTLDLSEERLRMAEALEKLEAHREVEVHSASSLTDMRDKLRDLNIHILHYLGHSGYLAEEGLGALYVDQGAMAHTQVNGDLFAEFVADVASLRLVVLNTCRSARYSGGEGRPFIASVAGGILQRTGCSVVAMQQVISDQAAIAFSSTLYKRLAKGDPLDVAVSDARLAMSPQGREWSTPVLFLSSADGKIFDVADRMDEQSAGRKEVAPSSLPPKRLGIRSFVPGPDRQDWGRLLSNRCDEVIDLRDSFDSRHIREDRLWHDKVFPALSRGLRVHSLPGRPLKLDLAAHQSVAFAAGWILESKGGFSVSIYQSNEEWRADDGSDSSVTPPLWAPSEDVLLDGNNPDIALAINVSLNHEIVDEVRAYIVEEELPVGRIIRAVPTGGSGGNAVRGGAHALLLAQALSRRVQRRQPHERNGRIHVFGALPNALAFYLGQISRPWGGVTLYEYPFDEEKNYAHYDPSLELPPPSRK